MNPQKEYHTTLRDVIFILFKHKILILICLFSVVITVAKITANQIPAYLATTKLLIKIGRENVYQYTTPGSTRTIMDSSTKIERMNTELTILRGRDLINSVIEDIGLKNIYPWLAPRKDLDNNTSPSKIQIERAIAMFKNDLSLNAMERSNIINVGFIHANPVTAAIIANTLVDHFLIEHLRIYQNPERLNFFEDQVKKYKDILRKSENDLKLFKKNNNVSAIIPQKQDLLSKISGFNSDIAKTCVGISETEANLMLLNEKEASGETSQMNLDAITSIRGKVTTLKLTEQQLLSKYKPSNLKIVNIRSEIKAAEELIKSEEKVFFKKEKIGLQNELDALNSKLSALKKYLQVFQDELDFLDRIELQLKDLVRKVNLDEKNYELYALRVEEVMISNEMDAQKIANISVVDKASPPLRPIASNNSLNLILSIIMGFFLGIAVALIIEYNSHSFNNQEDVIKNLQLKVLASIPELKKRSLLITLLERFKLQKDSAFS